MIENNWELYDYCMKYIETNSVIFFDEEACITDISGTISTGTIYAEIPGDSHTSKTRNAIIAAINLMNFYETTLKLSKYPKQWVSYISVSYDWMQNTGGFPPEFYYNSRYYETAKDDIDNNYEFALIKDSEFPVSLNLKENTLYYKNGLYMFETAIMNRHSGDPLSSELPSESREYRIWRRDSEIRSFRV